MSLGELQQFGQSRAFLLTIGGLTVRYYSGNVAPATTGITDRSGTGVGVNYTDVNAIVGVSNLRSSLDPAKGIASESGVTIRLASRGSFETASDPAKQLCRVGVRGATRYATLATTLAHATGSAVDVQTDRSLAAWAASGFFHCGSECFYYASTSGQDFVTPTRAVAYTRPQAHIVNVSESRTPIITPEVVNWRTRFALLQVANRRPDGSLGTFVDVVRGFVESTPVLDADGVTVVLTIVPNTSLLDMPIGGQVANSTAQETRLVAKHHASDGSVATSLEHQQYLRFNSWEHLANGAALTGSGALAFDDLHVNGWEALFDTGLAASHPRRGNIVRIATGDVMETDNTGAGSISLTDGAAPYTTDVVAGERFQALDVRERHHLDIHDRGVEQIVKWPDTALAAIVAGWVPGVHTGNGGAWADVKIEVQGGDGPQLMARSNSVPAKLALEFSARGLNPFDLGMAWRKAWYAFDLRAPDDDSYVDPTDVQAGRPSWSASFDVQHRADEWLRWPIRIPAGWFQRGEKFLLLEDQVLDVSGGTQSLRVTDGDGRQFIVPITAVSAAVDPDDGAAIGYRYTILERERSQVPSFGDWPNKQRVKVEPIVAFRDENPITVVLQLLSSGAGVGTNGAYDVLPMGLNLAVSSTTTTSEVDLASFLAAPVPPEVSRVSLVLASSEKPSEIIGPMMRLLGRAIVTKLDQNTGRRVIACVPATLERALDSVATVADGHILASQRPTSETDDEIFNRYEFKVNHDPITGEAGKPTIVFNDVPSIDEHCETRPLKLELRGLRIAADNPAGMLGVLMPTVNTLRAQFAQARRVHTFGLPFSKAVLLDPGQTITWSASDARDSQGTRGITSQAVRVLEVEHGLWTEGSTVKVVCHQLNGSGWAPALRVASVSSATVVVVEANYYTDARNPTTGATQTDVSFFAVGDAVECVPRGNFAGRASRTISIIAGNTVTLSAAHGLAAGDSIRPEDYDNAATAHQVYGFFADSAETLGAGAVDAKDIV